MSYSGREVTVRATLLITLCSLVCGLGCRPYTDAKVAGQTPDGRTRFLIECNPDVQLCHQRAARLCPHGYDVETGDQHNGESMGMAVNWANLTVVCVPGDNPQLGFLR